MSDERDPEDTLREWKAEMRAEHETAIAEPDPDEVHELEAVVQHSERVAFDLEGGELVETGRELVEAGDPERFGCSCGVRGMTREEAEKHLTAARD